ncbi:hypothetical protein SAMN05421813_14512 [Daejeonella rubra]|uniref:DUF1508 domain-containing protein n=1 Tax=Daejeonella rubra TaxID=990371 RepID=A0A1G9YWE6_9SPHI|nr:YegP family protein [Daejeonella rubra]SDN12871.1 hypothetical protein SAMN05421813_14512 [Daejeonella rubra]
MGVFVINKRENGDFQFNLKSGNGQIVLSSQGYSSKTSCENGIESVRLNSQDDSKFDFKIASNGKFYFVLKAANGQIIGTSEMYESESSLRGGIGSVKMAAKDALVKDLSLVNA